METSYWLLSLFQVYVQPLPPKGRGNGNRWHTVWQIAWSSSPTPFTLSEQRLHTHLQAAQTPRHFPTYSSVILHTHTHKHTRSIHRSTQCLTFSLNISYDLKICEERAVTALSFSFFISSLYFDSAWIRMSLYEQTASVLFQVHGLSWEQMKVTHCFQMLMKFPLRMNRIFGPPASENVFIHFQGGGRDSVLTFYHVLQGYSWHSLNWWFLLKFYIPSDLNQWGVLLLEIHKDGEEFKHWHSFEWVKICPAATLSFHLNLLSTFTSMPF